MEAVRNIARAPDIIGYVRGKPVFAISGGDGTGVAEYTTVEELESRLKDVKERLAAIDAEYGTRAIKGTETEAEWNDLNTEADELKARITEKANRAARLAELAEDEERAESGDGGKPTRYSPAKSAAKPEWTFDLAAIRRDATSDEDLAKRMRDNALHMVEQEKFPHPTAKREQVQAHIEKLLDTIDVPNPEGPGVPSALARRILVTGNPIYKRAFGKYLAGAGLSPEEQRALSVGTGSAGGFALVYNLDPTVVPTSNFSVNPWRALARVETISGTNEFKFVTSGAITSAYSAEAAETSDNAPTLAQPDIIVEKAQAFVPFSVEVGQDWGALQSEMAALLQDSKDDLEATKFATGAGHGSTEPKGVLTGATNTTGTTTTAAFVVGDLYKVFEAVPPRFRPRSQFVANLFIIDKIRQFGTADAIIWAGMGQLQRQADAGGAGTLAASVGIPLFGRQVYESTAMGAVLTTTTKILLVGDFRYFVIVDRIGMNIEVVPTVFGTAHRPTGQRGLYAYWRNSSDVLSAAAFQVLVT